MTSTPARTRHLELQAAVEEIAAAGWAGVQVRVNGPDGEWTGSAGRTALDSDAPPPTDGHFRIGSNTKTFTATLVLLLVADGLLGLDDPVDDHLPAYGLDRRITVRMLLQHTSGLFNHTGEYYEDGSTAPGIPWEGQAWVDNLHLTYRPEELVRLALGKPSRFEPGTGWSYSNTNYVLARLLVEQLTGRPYAEEMRRRILTPLGLTGTLVPDASPELPEPHAHGYYTYQDGEEWRTVDVTRSDPSWISAAGDMVSTTRDLHLFFSALLGGRLLPAALLAEMRTPHTTFAYGLGLIVEETEAGTLYTHNGGFWGWGALMYGSPDGSTTLTASLTTGDARLELPQAAEAFAKVQQLLLPLAFPPKP
ncbi:serine hydrolase domain-containing protein [Kitasatospora sp. NPDC096147]|uniref:serine hydrolase domain-containing protein n=1 Tax=Kitasatospora sp. NPDC096147 TaxID=3364093 RepID=UPI00381CA3F6